ncbi:hypothetical protein [Nonomuraea fuscirosea]|uniref:hypothetical protein n=1 Tax=Nonomuraea fuscirosea TaxID=1291556 RepID=UPI003426812B
MTQSSPSAMLQEIGHQMGVAAKLGADATTRQGEEIIHHLGAAQEIRHLIGQVLPDDGLLASIAARSYYHANNFLKVVLMAGDQDAWKLRLHVWHPRSPGTEIKMEDVHSHRWDFTTAIVLGKYRALEFGTGPGDEYHHYKYLPVGENQTFSLEAHGQERLHRLFDAILPAGTTYHLDHRVLHSICRASDGPTASIVLHGPAMRDSTNVFRTSPAGDQVKSETRVERPSVDQLHKELEQFIDWL